MGPAGAFPSKVWWGKPKLLLVAAGVVDTSAYALTNYHGMEGTAFLWWLFDLWLLRRIWRGGETAYAVYVGLTVGALGLVAYESLSSTVSAGVQRPGWATIFAVSQGIQLLLLASPAVRSRLRYRHLEGTGDSSVSAA